jgi:hypothetical protein
MTRRIICSLLLSLLFPPVLLAQDKQTSGADRGFVVSGRSLSDSAHRQPPLARRRDGSGESVTTAGLVQLNKMSIEGNLSVGRNYSSAAAPPDGMIVQGNVGIGTTNPQRLLQLGSSVDALFTLEPTDGSPNAGYIRFGDNTGWYMHFSRSRERSGGPLNTGLQGVLVSIRDDGAFFLAGFPVTGGSDPLCRNLANAITRCSSSLRYKTNLAPYRGGLDIINRLNPITFTWKDGGLRDIGLAAEEVEKVEPLFTFPNDKGEIEGIKYGQLAAVFVNAIKEQQAEIRQQQQLIKQLQLRLRRVERRGRRNRK